MIRTLVTALAATLALGAASAQQMDTAKAVERLRAADANGDGALTKAEFAAYRAQQFHRAQQFQRLDRDGDGYLTDADTQQLKRFASRMPPGMEPGQMIARFDADGDGKVNEAEFANGPTPAFDAVDANGDGVATKAEFEAAAAKAKAR